ncbi:hypothetical protein [Salinarimonas soli]|uniref:Phasin domain-containing protein n=1 Tax=Salinarimonas soli TaxID=1638099 RepID=A0A5B2V639_9HYPH|nr:hypothetical protein [Salinarimonas soli]KAA2233980.1 hypothetical protein F0L46_24475 [Salinarimonas soli]
MSKKTVRFKLHVAGETPGTAGASAEAWIGAAKGRPDAGAHGDEQQPRPDPDLVGLADAMTALAQGAQDAVRAGASFDRGPAADALERVLRAKTASELAAAQNELARAGLEQGFLQMSRATQTWADAVAAAARCLSPRRG